MSSKKVMSSTKIHRIHENQPKNEFQKFVKRNVDKSSAELRDQLNFEIKKAIQKSIGELKIESNLSRF